MRAVLRFVTYKITRDPDGEVTFQARCVCGDDKECGAESNVLGGEEAVSDWMAEHTVATGHRRFERIFKDYALVQAEG
ncbi:DUF7848 domain-containing protein [Streptomyces alanosinicus]|uniref:DUF7848 domain-containing protein n=1 Tax=Streptomyces alanosinicus TaxID=68171 RepID=A0A919D4U3_9ACTN|nr:hypothetical protein [Streptomyces alanosinicus]GHE08524.1 hypothetical protein GCM10010339_57590 [Streptomyces alanosinicus]